MKMKTHMSLITSVLGLSLIACTTSLHASDPVIPAENQLALLEADDPQLAANKKFIYDFFRIVVRGGRTELAQDYVHDGYIQHNPRVATGIDGLIAFLKGRDAGGVVRDIPTELTGLVNVSAEGDYVILSFALACKLDDGTTYMTTKFDMLRLVDGKVAEHWDSAHVIAPGVPRCQRTNG